MFFNVFSVSVLNRLFSVCNLEILLNRKTEALVEVGGTYRRPWKPWSARRSFISLPNTNQRNS